MALRQYKPLSGAAAVVIVTIFCSVALAQDAKLRVFEVLPDRLQARIEMRSRLLRQLAPANIAGASLGDVIRRSKKWTPGQTLKIAFAGGNDDLHKAVATAASEWTRWGNIKFDFGLDANTGHYRSWKSTDQDYAADIRISFDQEGYWSTVGRDGITVTICKPSEASMNFGGFQVERPDGWEGVVLHEFGHALGFEHEHQHPFDGCDTDFRWEDDQGYTPTTDQFGQYIIDQAGKRPGVYTVLGGAPNNWPKAKVDFNLRQLHATESSAFDAGPFDKTSIMKYYFPDWMFVRGTESHCFSNGENLALSDQDKKGFAAAYPADAPHITALVEQQKKTFAGLKAIPKLEAKLKAHFDAQLQKLNDQ